MKGEEGDTSTFVLNGEWDLLGMLTKNRRGANPTKTCKLVKCLYSLPLTSRVSRTQIERASLEMVIRRSRTTSKKKNFTACRKLKNLTSACRIGARFFPSKQGDRASVVDATNKCPLSLTREWQSPTLWVATTTGAPYNERVKMVGLLFPHPSCHHGPQLSTTQTKPGEDTNNHNSDMSKRKNSSWLVANYSQQCRNSS